MLNYYSTEKQLWQVIFRTFSKIQKKCRQAMIFPGMRRKTPSERQRAVKRPEKFAANEQKGDRLRKISLKRMTRRGAQKGIRAHGQRSRNRPQRVRRLRPPIAANDRNKRPQRVRRLCPPIATNDCSASDACVRRSQQTIAARPTLAAADRGERSQRTIAAK